MTVHASSLVSKIRKKIILPMRDTSIFPDLNIFSILLLNLNSTHQELFILVLRWGRHDEWLHPNGWEENEAMMEAALDLSSRKMLLPTVWHSGEVSRCLQNQGTVCGKDQGTRCPRITFHMLNEKKN